MFLFIYFLDLSYNIRLYSNTSHVLIYLSSQSRLSSCILFKYISCSYLSFQFHHFHYLKHNSNTSHVLIYPFSDISTLIGSSFKYISCSYLSEYKFLNNPLVNQFKYISCSYLSPRRYVDFFQSAIFKYISCSYLSVWVALYSSNFFIQIHLMFLFIQ